MLATLYVAPKGRDDWSGHLPQPLADGSDGPFATLERARDEVRICQDRNDCSPGGVTVWLGPGTHVRRQSFTLSPEHGGTPGAPIVYCGQPNTTVRVSGGQELAPTQFTPVTDAELRARLPAAAREHVLQVDLRAAGITDWGALADRGFGWPALPADLELFVNDVPLPQSRWPREGYLATGTVTDPGTLRQDAAPRGATFTLNEPLPPGWGTAPDLLCFGYWYHDWAPATMRVRAVSTADRTVSLAAGSAYGVQAGKRYYFINLPEALDQPGAWYLDGQHGRLYVWPTADWATARIVVSLLATPLLRLEGASHVTFEGLILECARGTGLELAGGEGVRVVGCTCRNLGLRGMDVDGRNHGIISCDLHDLGQGGIWLRGGDRKTLSAGGNFAINNHLHHFNRVCQTYCPAIRFDGVGHRAAHNLIHDAPHFALSLGGNDHVIENNEIADVGLDTDDAGAFYMGRNPSERGIIIRGNFFHHVGNPFTDWGTGGVYLDDGACGVTVTSNVFYRVGVPGRAGFGAIFINGGKDNVFDSNVFVRCPQVIGRFDWGDEAWAKFARGETIDYVRRWLYEDVNVMQPPYVSRYPALRELLAHSGRNCFWRNLRYQCDEFFPTCHRQELQDNLELAADPGFADPAQLDFTLPTDSPLLARLPGFQPPPPRAAIGLYVDEWRRALPQRPSVDVIMDLATPLPAASAAGPRRAQLQVQVANRGLVPSRGCVQVRGLPAAAVRLPDGADVTYDLAPGETHEALLAVELLPGSDADTALAAQARSGPACGAVLELSGHYHITIARLPDLPLAALAERLGSQPALLFTQGGQTVGELRLALAGETLAVVAHVHDARFGPDQTQWGCADNPWGGAVLALFASPATGPGIRQVALFPTGPERPGDVHLYATNDRLPTPAFPWQTHAATPCGYELTALVPLSALNLSADVAQFRFEAFIIAAAAPATAARALPLFGSRRPNLGNRGYATVEVTNPNPKT